MKKHFKRLIKKVLLGTHPFYRWETLHQRCFVFQNLFYWWVIKYRVL